MQLELAAGFQPVHAGHDDVERDQVGSHAARDAERRQARVGDKGLVALLRQNLAQQAEVGRRIVDDQDRRVDGKREVGESDVVHALSWIRGGVG